MIERLWRLKVWFLRAYLRKIIRIESLKMVLIDVFENYLRTFGFLSEINIGSAEHSIVKIPQTLFLFVFIHVVN